MMNPNNKNAADTLPNRPTKGGETSVDSNSHITGFQSDDFEKIGEN